MIFSGDISQPFTGASKYKIPESLESKIWFGNLEGSLINDSVPQGVYNSYEAIKTLCRNISFTAIGVANNHLLDAADVNTTIKNADKIGVGLVGCGLLPEASMSLSITDEGTTYRILTFGWENIQCVQATDERQGVNPYTRKNVFKCVKEALKKNDNVLCFMHWDYELEKYPQPYDRQLAMELIDIGVSAVIGCHAHRVQPVEFYKGRPIVYGLGNFLFYQGHYFNGQLRFPKFCEEEYAFEITDGGQKFKLHHFHYDSENNNLEYVKSEDVGPDMDFDGKAEFTGFDSEEYEKWFRKHRVQKKLLPIFKARESDVTYAMKSCWIKLRGTIINILTKFNLKSANRGQRK